MSAALAGAWKLALSGDGAALPFASPADSAHSRVDPGAATLETAKLNLERKLKSFKDSNANHSSSCLFSLSL